MRIVLLMFLIVVLVALFGNVLSYFVTLTTAGYNWLLSSLAIPFDFFSKALVSMFSFGYIRTILSVFLAIELTLFIISALKGDVSAGFSEGLAEASIEDEQIEKAVNKPMNRRKGKQKLVAVHGQKLSHGINKKVKLVKGYNNRIFYRK